MPKTRPAPHLLVPLQVRMPETLRQQLTDEAKQNGRSLNSEIVWRLSRSVGDEGLVDRTATERAKMLDEILDALRQRRKGK